MFCRHCGGAVTEGAEFCPRCGNRFVAPAPPLAYTPPPVAGVPVAYPPPRRKIPWVLIGSIVGIVVLLGIVAVVLTVPRVVRAVNSTSDRWAKQSLEDALDTAKTMAAAANGRFTDRDGRPLSPKELNENDPYLSFSASGRDATIGVLVDKDPTDHDGSDATRIWLWTQSESGRWFALKATRSGSVSYCSYVTEGPAFQRPCEDRAWPE